MKKINLKIKKYILILGIFVYLSTFSMRAFALDPVQNALTIAQTANMVIDDIRLGVQAAKTVVTTAKSAAALAKNIKNFDMSMLASNLSGVAIKQIGDAVTQSISIKRDAFTNPLTNGAQVVTDLKGFLKSNGENAIRNVLNDQATQSGTNPYISTALKNVTKKIRSEANESIAIKLPFVAQKEICNSDKLKNIVKNGEPKTYINPKPSVKNVDIDKLCNTDLSSETEGKSAQVVFIGLAKAGYGGPLTNVALADPANTPSGVAAALEDKINKAYNESITNATNQYTSNGGIIGSQICVDKDGKAKKFDASDPNKAFCDNLVTSASSSAAVIKSNIDAARLSPYLDILAKAQSTNASCGGSGSSSSDISALSQLQGGSSSGGASFNDIACGISKYANQANSFLDIANSILGMGYSSNNGQSPDFTTNNTYAQLATTLDNVVGITKSSFDLGDASKNSNKEYALGITATATADRIPVVLDLYKQAREINTEKLNEEVYTYSILKLALGYTGQINQDYKTELKEVRTKGAILNVFTYNLYGLLGGNKKNKKAYADLINIRSATNKFNTAFNNLGKDIRSLISQMAYNNYKEQKLNELQNLFLSTNARPEDNMDKIAKALDNTITEEQLAEVTLDWNFISKFTSSENTPNIDDKSTKQFIPTDYETSAPFSAHYLENIRLRAFQLVKNYAINSSTSNPYIPSFLNGFGYTSLLRFTPDVPRKAYPFQVSSKNSSTYSEKAYCEKIGIGICDLKNLTMTQNTINNLVYQLQNDPNFVAVSKNVSEICASPETEIKNFCSSSDGTSNEYCKSTASTTELIQQFVESNCSE
jgi:hypothetical protein